MLDHAGQWAFVSFTNLKRTWHLLWKCWMISVITKNRCAKLLARKKEEFSFFKISKSDLTNQYLHSCWWEIRDVFIFSKHRKVISLMSIYLTFGEKNVKFLFFKTSKNVCTFSFSFFITTNWRGAQTARQTPTCTSVFPNFSPFSPNELAAKLGLEFGMSECMDFFENFGHLMDTWRIGANIS